MICQLSTNTKIIGEWRHSTESGGFGSADAQSLNWTKLADRFQMLNANWMKKDSNITQKPPALNWIILNFIFEE